MSRTIVDWSRCYENVLITLNAVITPEGCSNGIILHYIVARLIKADVE